MTSRKAAPDHPDADDETILEVVWDSGVEQLDIVKIRARLEAPEPGAIQTIEVRGDGEGLVRYQPQLARATAGSDLFTLTYRESGRWIVDGVDADDAGGDLGTATYREVDGRWQCAWQSAADASVTSTPECRWAGATTSRLMQACFRALRDPAFRKRILALDICCAVTGETDPLVLEAAHVVGVGQNGSDDAGNGLLLRRDLHALFDAHLLTLDGNGVFSIAADATRYYQDLFDEPRQLGPAQLARLKKNIQKRNAWISRNAVA